VYAGKILKGEEPADPPVDQPAKFNLSVNPKDRAGVNLNVPASLLGRADPAFEQARRREVRPPAMFTLQGTIL
jgi:putative tryptophan/tyrosine transport system substrate-binding protein